MTGEAWWGRWWPGARERADNGGASSTNVRLDSAERRSEANGKPKPNVFFILIDDMGWNDIGYQSKDLHAVTPNLNRMAAAGIRVRVRVLRPDAAGCGSCRVDSTEPMPRPDVLETTRQCFFLYCMLRINC